jgi:hypothetical protein
VVATTFLHLLCCAGVLLVGCCVIFSFVGGRLRPQRIFVVIVFLHQFAAPSKETTPPHTFHPGRLSSSMPLPPSMPTFGWLLCPPIKRQPSKAEGPPISLFFSLINIPPPNDGQPSSPHVPTRPHLFSNAPSNVDTVFHLIVVYIDRMAAT